MVRVVRKKGTIGYEDLKVRIEELNKLKAFVGWLDSAKYDDNTPVAGVAAVHEFGSVRRSIPPRPFFRVAIEENYDKWMDIIKEGAKGILRGEFTAEQVMELIGLTSSGDVKNAIVAVDTPPLSPQTIAKKGHADPLRDTGLMLATLTYEVRE